jgi:tetratricopeptide (TPR) repeat protein
MEKYELSLQMYERALKIRKASLGEEHADTLESYGDVADALNNMENYDKAEKMYKLALFGMDKALGNTHDSTIEMAKRLIKFYTDDKEDDAKADEVRKKYGITEKE